MYKYFRLSENISVFNWTFFQLLKWKTQLNKTFVNYGCKNINNIGPCGLYYKHILTIVSDNHKWRLYYKCFISALASVINYASKWCHSLESHLLTTLESSFMIVKIFIILGPGPEQPLLCPLEVPLQFEESCQPVVNITNILQAPFYMKVICTACTCLQFGFVISRWKDFGTKGAHKMLVKMKPVVNIKLWNAQWNIRSDKKVSFASWCNLQEVFHSPSSRREWNVGVKHFCCSLEGKCFWTEYSRMFWLKLFYK